MSHSTLYADFGNGHLAPVREYKNGWGAAPFVWDVLVEKAGLKALVPMMAWTELFDWAPKNPDKLTWFERATLDATCDRVIVPRNQFLDLAEAFEAFTQAHGKPKRVNHLPVFAADLRKLHEDEKVQHAAWQQTSVADNQWVVYEGEDARAYDVQKDKNHFFLKVEKPACTSAETSS